MISRAHRLLFITAVVLAAKVVCAATFHRNGGTLIALGTNPSFLTTNVIAHANVRNDWARIETAGNDIAIAQADSNYVVKLVVADSGSPSLSATQQFKVNVLPVSRPTLSVLGNGAGEFPALVAGNIGPDYTVQASTNLIVWMNLFTTNPATMLFTWSDIGATNFTYRFYRVLLGP